MDGAGQRALTRFVDELSRLRRLAGTPSLNQLVECAADLPRPLRRSTLSDKLNAKSLPDWDFVVSFVAACRAYAEATGAPLPADEVDLARWDTAHLQLLAAVDAARADNRTAPAVAAEFGRRAARLLPTAPPPAGPRQLPADVFGFAGRTTQLAALDRLLDEPGPDPAVVISSVSGTAGVGKTALAVRWAHRVTGHFPDGQLYVNLRGFGPEDAAMAPADALRGFLDAFGVPPPRIPPGVDALAAQFRSVLAGKRVLVVLDNAASAAQVRPLLPGARGCLAVVTSRNALTGLTVLGARPLILDLLSADEARQLLAGRLGEDRTAADRSAVDDIIDRCARLPLALSIAAARTAERPGYPIRMLADELNRARDSLDAFDAGDRSTDVRAVFSWSYDALSPAAARLLRLLGLHPGPDITAPAAASLAGQPEPAVRRLLTELSRAHLLTEHLPGRFTFHDLLRVYATELAASVDTEAERHAAVNRVLDHYLLAADTAGRRLGPHREKLDLVAPQVGVTREELPDPDRALAWFDAEHRVLLAVVGLAARTSLRTHTWLLAWIVADLLDRRGHSQDRVAVLRIALDATTGLADRAAMARVHRGLAIAVGRLGDHDEALLHHQRSLALFGELGDRTGQARTHLNIAAMLERLGDHEAQLVQTQRALDLFVAAGDRSGEANALNAVGWTYAQLREPLQTLTYARRALAVQEEIGDVNGAAATLDTLGYAQHELGDDRAAVDSYRRALDLVRATGTRSHEPLVLMHLGDAHLAAGDRPAARRALVQALEILQEIDHPDAHVVRSRIERLG
jgi:tetratricopeptide (TPR) repeat protein